MVSFVAFVAFVALSGCTSLEQDERDYTSRMQKLDALAAKATPATKTELAQKKDALAKRYAALPTTPKERRDALDAIDADLYRLLAQYGDRVDEEAKAAEVGPLAGTWRGGGVTLTIKPDRGFSYAKKADGESTTMTGRITSMTDAAFVTDAFGESKTFALAKRPYEDTDGKWKMVLDGVTMIRD